MPRMVPKMKLSINSHDRNIKRGQETLTKKTKYIGLQDVLNHVDTPALRSRRRVSVAKGKQRRR